MDDADSSAPTWDDDVLAHMPLVRMIASSLYRKHGFNGVPYEDYVQFGAEGLMQALRNYVPVEGARFETYASHRIRGAILSGLEKFTEINQQVMALRRLAQDRLQSVAPEDSTAMGSQPEQAFARLLKVSVGLAIAFMLEDTALYADEHVAHWDDGAANVSFKQLQQRLKRALDTLNDKERRVMQQHYFEHDTFQEIAAGLGLTRGRISQIHREALDKLRTALKGSPLQGLTG
jgi:RNA polymerase sigma factor for flagellar operon FliA